MVLAQARQECLTTSNAKSLSPRCWFPKLGSPLYTQTYCNPDCGTITPLCLETARSNIIALFVAGPAYADFPILLKGPKFDLHLVVHDCVPSKFWMGGGLRLVHVWCSVLAFATGAYSDATCSQFTTLLWYDPSHSHHRAPVQDKHRRPCLDIRLCILKAVSRCRRTASPTMLASGAVSATPAKLG